MFLILINQVPVMITNEEAERLFEAQNSGSATELLYGSIVNIKGAYTVDALKDVKRICKRWASEYKCLEGTKHKFEEGCNCGKQIEINQNIQDGFIYEGYEVKRYSDDMYSVALVGSNDVKKYDFEAFMWYLNSYKFPKIRTQHFHVLLEKMMAFEIRESEPKQAEIISDIPF